MVLHRDVEQWPGVIGGVARTHAMAKGMVKGIVASLPVVWRVANWI